MPTLGSVPFSRHWNVAARSLASPTPTSAADVTALQDSNGGEPLQLEGEKQRGKQGERRVCVLSSDPKNPLFDECAGVRLCDVTGGLWVSRSVGFRGLSTQGEEGEERTTDGGGGGPFFSRPCHVTAGLVVGAALSVLVHGLTVQLRTGAVAQMATQRLPWNC